MRFDMDLNSIFTRYDIKGLADDSRLVQPGFVFFSFAHSSRLQYVKKALEQGAILIIADIDAPFDVNAAWIKVESVKKARLHFAIHFFENPFSKLIVHGVTGTNGKTTTAFLMDSLLNAAGKKTALIGTVYNKIADKVMDSVLTTPGLLSLYAFAKNAVDAGCTDLIMEVSSHALEQERIEGLLFYTALFSNLTQDHLDYHGTMSHYFEAKVKLFTKYLANDACAIINVDNLYGEQLYQLLSDNKIAVSREKRKIASVYLESSKLENSKLCLTVPSVLDSVLCSNLIGDFNVDNLLLVLAFAKFLNISQEQIQRALSEVLVPGRFEMVYHQDNKCVIVDYAHTPDALERVLKSARALCEGRLTVLFGCGGDRDKEKRPLMGEIASMAADLVWLSSDNPRTENPMQIIEDILFGIKNQKNVRVVENRREAIQMACLEMKEKDCLIIAGKGHENYQIIGNVKHPFDDKEEVRRVFNAF